MTAAELKALRQRLGLTQQQIADYCLVSVRAVKHWEAGTRAISRQTEKLLRML